MTGGVCTTKPTNQPSAFVPSCGCDNVTYWNETIAGGFGANVKAAGVCPPLTAATCKPSTMKCAVGRSCNLDASQCAVATPNGVCWGLPTICPGDPTERACGGSSGSGSCISYCTAARNEKTFFKDTLNCP